MKFSPYRQREVGSDSGPREDADYEYDSDDSEDAEYPVHPNGIPSIVAWAAYQDTTKQLVSDAIVSKNSQVGKLKASIASWSQQQMNQSEDRRMIDSQNISALLQNLRIEQDVEDRTSNSALQERYEAQDAEIAAVIADEIRKIEESKKKAREEQARKEKIEQQRVEAERQMQAATRKQLEAENLRVEALNKEALAKEERSKALGMTPETEARRWRSQLEDLKVDVLKKVSENAQLKAFCHRARGKMVPRIGQVTKSISTIEQISSVLKVLFEEAGTQDPENLAQRWCFNFFCKQLVRQAEEEVMVKPTACYPLAFLAISLMRSFPVLTDIFLCRVAKKCPWIIPYVGYDKNTESGRKHLGWKRGRDSKYEAITIYKERQTGIFRLWAAIASLKVQDPPISIKQSWTFIARLLNAEIHDAELMNVAFVMGANFLEISGKAFTVTYGSQAAKLIRALALWVGPDINGPSANYLRTLLEKYVAEGAVGIAFNFEP